ncbi:sodium/potassium/calcium exchanger 3-like isoform X2 [Anneissia japonica]|uniref:sodium/potassium/calcium exchanger 3-like isoform X2 n=1 Tax=Anneissia japonica TaxID=1529436 RepID=UPI00142554A4|nr:sodium/potassium/calcium exchanger 3-like isoform X2 [Anneissia japonica]
MAIVAIRRRRSFLWRRILFISFVCLLVAAIRNIGFSRASNAETVGGDDILFRRHLMSVETDNSSDDDVSDEHLDRQNCTPPTIHEFPPDIFTNQQRKTGALVVHICVVVYMFIALAIVCDDYFVSSLEKICERLGFSEDVAGATFMAAGSSAPELFTSVIGVFIANGDVGVGTIIGSAVFNILIIIGICALFAGQVVSLTWWPLFRDTTVYSVSIATLIYVIHDGKVQWYESLVMLLLYAVYIFIMWLNPKLYSKIERRSEKRRLKKAEKAKSEAKSDIELEQVTPLNPRTEAEPVIMVDEYICNSPKRLTFPDAGFRVMLSKHFPARTRMRTACWVIITERHLMQKDPDSIVYVATPATNGKMHKSHSTYSSLSRKSQGSQKSLDVEEATGNIAGEVEEGPESPFNIPDGCWNIAKWILTFPLSFVLYITVPDCRRERFHSWYMLTFLMSIVWIVVFSYIMVWMVALIGYTLRIPDTIMGIAFLAAGTSVPDAMASLLVARQGLGDMAVSNCIGSNVFDILLGLALPWFIKTTLVNYGSFITINSRGLIYSVILLFASVTATIITIHCNKWKLDRRVGILLMIFYAIFLTFSILVEFNMFGYVNPPIC